jgi:hypothetical protein
MSINFPNSPSLNQLYTYDNKTWEWNGIYWEVYSALTSYITSAYTSGDGVSSISGISNGNIVLKSFSGININIVDSGNKLTFSASTPSIFTGGTVTGATNFTGGLSANTMSATTYFNVPNIYNTNGKLFENREVDINFYRLDFVNKTSNLQPDESPDWSQIIPSNYDSSLIWSNLLPYPINSFTTYDSGGGVYNFWYSNVNIPAGQNQAPDVDTTNWSMIDQGYFDSPADYTYETLGIISEYTLVSYQNGLVYDYYYAINSSPLGNPGDDPTSWKQLFYTNTPDYLTDLNYTSSSSWDFNETYFSGFTVAYESRYYFSKFDIVPATPNDPPDVDSRWSAITYSNGNQLNNNTISATTYWNSLTNYPIGRIVLLDYDGLYYVNISGTTTSIINTMRLSGDSVEINTKLGIGVSATTIQNGITMFDGNLVYTSDTTSRGSLYIRSRNDNQAGVFADYNFIKESDFNATFFETYDGDSPGSYAAQYIYKKSRGYFGTPEDVGDGDQLGGFYFRGYSSNDYRQRAGLAVFVDGEPNGTTVPLSILFFAGSTSLTERMRLKPDGSFRVGSDSLLTRTTSGETIETDGSVGINGTRIFTISTNSNTNPRQLFTLDKSTYNLAIIDYKAMSGSSVLRAGTFTYTSSNNSITQFDNTDEFIGILDTSGNTFVFSGQEFLNTTSIIVSARTSPSSINYKLNVRLI